MKAFEDMTTQAQDNMKGKTLGNDEEGEEERVPGERSGDLKHCGALRVRERQHQPRGLNPIGSEDRALRRG